MKFEKSLDKKFQIIDLATWSVSKVSNSNKIGSSRLRSGKYNRCDKCLVQYKVLIRLILMLRFEF